MHIEKSTSLFSLMLFPDGSNYSPTNRPHLLKQHQFTLWNSTIFCHGILKRGEIMTFKGITLRLPRPRCVVIRTTYISRKDIHRKIHPKERPQRNRYSVISSNWYSVITECSRKSIVTGSIDKARRFRNGQFIEVRVVTNLNEILEKSTSTRLIREHLFGM